MGVRSSRESSGLRAKRLGIDSYQSRCAGGSALALPRRRGSALALSRRASPASRRFPGLRPLSTFFRGPREPCYVNAVKSSSLCVATPLPGSRCELLLLAGPLPGNRGKRVAPAAPCYHLFDQISEFSMYYCSLTCWGKRVALPRCALDQVIILQREVY